METLNYTPEINNYTPESLNLDIIFIINNYTPEINNYTPEGATIIVMSSRDRYSDPNLFCTVVITFFYP
jgi:hypothetical protein